ncbi:MAG: hypothetical protein HY512_00995 [Candidatus Aenigmarchaeota archaeon]|nr:hypothetical protein [Candidatus Aenigmarchaeota archaeon]
MARIEVYVSKRLRDFVRTDPKPPTALVHILQPVYDALKDTGPTRVARPGSGDYEFNILREDKIDAVVSAINKLKEYTAKAAVQDPAPQSTS